MAYKSKPVLSPSSNPKIRQLTKQLKKIRTAKRQMTKFKKTKSRFNTVSHRILNRNSSLKGKKLLSTTFPNIFNPIIFEETKILSTPEKSVSGALVVLLKDKKEAFQYILKYTMIEPNNAIEKNLSYVDIEMYKVMKSLLNRSVTPHIFQGISYLHNIEKDVLSQKIQQTLDVYSSKYIMVSTMLNETADTGVDMMTFSAFRQELANSSIKDNLKYFIMVNILFQIMYTLNVFNLIDIKHNDLHFGNIFILIRKHNLLRNKSIGVSRLYKFKNDAGELIEVRLQNIGLDVRIYDFDRGYKGANDYKPYPGEIGSVIIKEYKNVNQTYNKNHSFDTYKVLCSLLSWHIKSKTTDPGNFHRHPHLASPKFETLVKSFFYDEDLYKKGRIKGVRVSYNPFFLLNRPLKKTEMKSTNEILTILSSKIQKNDFQIIETYSTENLFESSKEKFIKTYKHKISTKSTKLERTLSSSKKSTSKKVTRVTAI